MVLRNTSFVFDCSEDGWQFLSMAIDDSLPIGISMETAAELAGLISSLIMIELEQGEDGLCEPTPRRLVVVAPTHAWAEKWCRVNRPTVNIRSVIMVTNSHEADRLFGVRFGNDVGDFELVVTGQLDIPIKDWVVIEGVLKTRGWSA